MGLNDPTLSTAELGASAPSGVDFASWWNFNDGRPKPMRKTELTREQSRMDIAVHEAAHAVVGMAFGMSLEYSGVLEQVDGDIWSMTGRTRWGNCSVPCLRYAVSCAAGLRAEVRHLTERGLPAVEALGGTSDDREVAFADLADSNFPLREIGAPGHAMTWPEVEDAADHAIGLLWQQINTVAAAMYAAPDGLLTGDQVAALTLLPNPAPTAGGS
jgi:hypothetical protein